MAKIIKFLIKLIIGLTAPGFVFGVLLLNAVAHPFTHIDWSSEPVIISKITKFLKKNYNSFIGYLPRDSLVGLLKCNDQERIIPKNNDNFEKEFLLMKRNENIQLKVYSNEKEAIARNAERAGTDVSKYLRTVGIEEDKVIFLDKGAFIPRQLVEINDKITGALRCGKISDALGQEIVEATKTIMTKFVEVSQQLTTISPDDEEE